MCNLQLCYFVTCNVQCAFWNMQCGKFNAIRIVYYNVHSPMCKVQCAIFISNFTTLQLWIFAALQLCLFATLKVCKFVACLPRQLLSRQMSVVSTPYLLKSIWIRLNYFYANIQYILETRFQLSYFTIHVVAFFIYKIGTW